MKGPMRLTGGLRLDDRRLLFLRRVIKGFNERTLRLVASEGKGLKNVSRILDTSCAIRERTDIQKGYTKAPNATMPLRRDHQPKASRRPPRSSCAWTTNQHACILHAPPRQDFARSG
jgi:hypothetical protein